MIAPATMVCFGYQNRGAACPTPHAIAYVSRCEQVACAACMEQSLRLRHAMGDLGGTCKGCGARFMSAVDLQAHWRPIAGAV